MHICDTYLPACLPAGAYEGIEGKGREGIEGKGRERKGRERKLGFAKMRIHRMGVSTRVYVPVWPRHFSFHLITLHQVVLPNN